MSQAIAAKPSVQGARVKKNPVLDVDRSEEFRWLKEHAETYSGRWVAVLGSKLIADASTLQELLKTTGSLALDHRPLVHHLP